MSPVIILKITLFCQVCYVWPQPLCQFKCVIITSAREQLESVLACILITFTAPHKSGVLKA